MRLLATVVFLCAMVASCGHYSGTPDNSWAGYAVGVDHVERTKKR